MLADYGYGNPSRALGLAAVLSRDVICPAVHLLDMMMGRKEASLILQEPPKLGTKVCILWLANGEAECK